MWPYITLIVLPFLVRHIRVTNSINATKSNERALKIFWILLFLMLIFRHETIGNDTTTYAYIFRTIANSSWSSALGRSAEIGYTVLNKVVSLVTSNFRWVLILSAILGVYHISKAYLKYSTDAMLTISIFIIMSNFILLFSGLRQCIAISLGFVAFELTRSKKWIPFLLVTILAMLFHTSAFMIAFMYPLYHVQIKKKRLFLIVPLLLAVFVFNQQIFAFLGSILNRFTDYDAEIQKTGSITMLILFIMFAVFSYLIPNESKLDRDTIGMRNFLLLSVALQMFAPLHNLAMRMNYYYIAFIPILIPRIIACRSRRWNQVAVAARHIMVIFFIIYFFLTAPADNVLHTFPYRFFWESM